MAVALVLAAVVAPMGACSSGSGSDLVGPTWRWTHLTETEPAHQSVVPDPQNYTLTLSDDGTFSARADCNQVHGSYTTNGSSLTLKPGASTLAACGDNSLDTQYVTLLGTVTSYDIKDTDLTMQLGQGAGTMGFAEGS
ncbi:MAG TPA: META domain-containing protein [Actinomycetota bacterium]